MFDIRVLTHQDMGAASELEALCFSSFWTKEQFEDACRQPNFAGYGCFSEGMLIAYITLSVLEGELEVLNIAVRPEYRGQRLSRPLMGFALMDTLYAKSKTDHHDTVPGWEHGVLEVRAGNEAAKALYKSLGFTQAGLRPRYYSDGEDALIMNLAVQDFLHHYNKM